MYFNWLQIKQVNYPWDIKDGKQWVSAIECIDLAAIDEAGTNGATGTFGARVLIGSGEGAL